MLTRSRKRLHGRTLLTQIIIGLLVLGGCAVFVTGMFSWTYKKRFGPSVEVPAVVVKSYVFGGDSSQDSDPYHIAAYYEYENPPGLRRSGSISRRSPYMTQADSEFYLEELYPVGRQLTVFASKSDPELSDLDDPVKRHSELQTILGLLCFTAGGLLVFLTRNSVDQ